MKKFSFENCYKLVNVFDYHEIEYINHLFKNLNFPLMATEASFFEGRYIVLVHNINVDDGEIKNICHEIDLLFNPEKMIVDFID